jgi:hypothetical protein
MLKSVQTMLNIKRLSNGKIPKRAFLKHVNNKTRECISASPFEGQITFACANHATIVYNRVPQFLKVKLFIIRCLDCSKFQQITQQFYKD